MFFSLSLLHCKKSLQEYLQLHQKYFLLQSKSAAKSINAIAEFNFFIRFSKSRSQFSFFVKAQESTIISAFSATFAISISDIFYLHIFYRLEECFRLHIKVFKDWQQINIIFQPRFSFIFLGHNQIAVVPLFDIDISLKIF